MAGEGWWTDRRRVGGKSVMSRKMDIRGFIYEPHGFCRKDLEAGF